MDHLCIYFLDILRAYKYIIIFKLKLKLQYFGHLMRRVDSLEKTHAGRDWGQEEKGTTEDEMAGGITDSMEVSLHELQELVIDREAWRAAIGSQRVRYD